MNFKVVRYILHLVDNLVFYWTTKFDFLYKKWPGTQVAWANDSLSEISRHQILSAYAAFS